MARKRLVDLSIAIEPELPSDPPMMIPKIDYIDHEMGAEQMKEFYPGVKKEQLPGGLGWAVEFMTLTTHSGTHLDAPYHYHPTMDKGKPQYCSLNHHNTDTHLFDGRGVYVPWFYRPGTHFSFDRTRVVPATT
jgi:hypothetical protein